MSEEKKETAEMPPESEIRERAKAELTPQARASILKSVTDFALSLGKTAGALVDRIRGVRDPEAAIVAFDAQLKANRERREPLSARYEKLYSEIAAKKKAWQAAAPARKRILELELKTMLSEYKGIERQLAIYFENERMLNTVRGRTLELVANGLRKLSEKDVDRLTDDIEDAAAAAEDISGAMKDLENAGRRRESEDDQASFEEALAGFDEAVADTAASEAGEAADPLAGFEETERPAAQREGDPA